MAQAKIDPSFWSGKRVLITGHTGFKGGWLAFLLSSIGSKVTGYALAPMTKPNFFSVCHIDEKIDSRIADIRDLRSLKECLRDVKPEIVIHMAAQPLVRRSYLDPVETYDTNIMGTVNVLEAVRNCDDVKVLINVTTDKCYENSGMIWPFRESDPLGGGDPYSSSKACSELVTAAYSKSFLNLKNTSVSTARAGNVIGGGDWSADRLIPDLVKAIQSKKELTLRYPDAIRPWQHVMEPISGYLLLAEKMWNDELDDHQAWNFGPLGANQVSVKKVIDMALSAWGISHPVRYVAENEFVESSVLRLDTSKSQFFLEWEPTWDLQTSVEQTMEWYSHFYEGGIVSQLTNKQIRRFFDL